MKPSLSGLLFGLIACFAVNSQSAGQNYDSIVQPKRRALVVGNANYRHLPELPSAAVDAMEMDRKLAALGFNVMTDSMTSAFDFWDRVMPAFVSRIDSGDIALIYVSGHGFSLDRHNWLAPLDLPGNLRETEVPDGAVALENIGSLVAERSPALVLILSDACRAIPGFAVVDDSGRNVAETGLAEEGGQFSNGIVGYATTFGKFAIARSFADTPSVFTRHLISYIDREGTEFNELYQRVTGAVKRATDSTQIPALSRWSPSLLYFKPGANVLEQLRDLWSAAYKSKDPHADVAEFLDLYATSNHAMAARLWIRQNPRKMIASNYTAVSPLAVERAWDPGSVSITIQPNAVGLAFGRVVHVRDLPEVLALSRAQLGIARMTTTANAAIVGANASVVSAHENVVTTRDFIARARPTTAGQPISRVPAGTTVNILGIERQTPTEAWLAATVPQLDSIVYLRMATAGGVPEPLRLGKALLEVTIPASATTRGAIDAGAIRAVIERLNSEKKRVMWISLSTGPTPDSVEARFRRMMLVHAEHTLKSAGVGGRRITSVSAVPNGTQDGVRMRVFGWEP